MIACLVAVCVVTALLFVGMILGALIVGDNSEIELLAKRLAAEERLSRVTHEVIQAMRDTARRLR